MSYVAYITRIKNLRKHSAADRLQIGECFGNSVVVPLNYEEGQLGVYFPTDGKLSKEFAEANNLLRKKDDSGNNTGGYLDPDKRHITAIRLRGEKSDGLFLPISCLDYLQINTPKQGECFSELNGTLICEKYIPRGRPNVTKPLGEKKRKVIIAPMFSEHSDTSQLAYSHGAFKAGDHVEISLKMHGTSQRTALLPSLKGLAKRKLLDRLLRREAKQIYEWGYVSGTRRTVLESFEGGYYGTNSFREAHSKKFEGKLRKGETVYYEVVGYVNEGSPIMRDCDNKKLNDKDFVKKYGPTTTFSYGCAAGESEAYVYRMTMTNEDGDVVEYPHSLIAIRCEQMGLKVVPLLWSGFIPNEINQDAGEWIQKKAEEFYNGKDPIGLTHIREGVVCRIVNREKFTAYKHKNFEFKVIEGIIKATAETPDLEESQEAQA